MHNTYYTYIMSSSNNSTLYIGVTNDLVRRVAEHKSGSGSVFTAKYHCHKLVYYDQAIAREKQLKGWKRERKDALIDSVNKERQDLSV